VKINSFAELTVWQRGHQLALLVYQMTAGFPKSELFGVVPQLRGAMALVSANIAQGFARRTTRELLRSLQIAAGEMEEVRCFLILGRDLGYVRPGRFGEASAMRFGRAPHQRAGTLFATTKPSAIGLRDLGVTNHESPVTNHGSLTQWQTKIQKSAG
jgi:four helix bundle protein